MSITSSCTLFASTGFIPNVAETLAITLAGTTNNNDAELVTKFIAQHTCSITMRERDTTHLHHDGL